MRLFYETVQSAKCYIIVVYVDDSYSSRVAGICTMKP